MDNLERRNNKTAGMSVEKRGEKPLDGLVLVGYAAVFDSLSEDLGGFRETINPGAFTESLKTADVRALFDHDCSKVLGRIKSGTLHCLEDSHGLKVEIDLPDTSIAWDLAESVKRGDIDAMSFSFQVEKDDWKTDDKGAITRQLIQVCVDEVSIVTFPAYLETTVAVRSLDRWKSKRNFQRRDQLLRKIKLLELKMKA